MSDPTQRPPHTLQWPDGIKPSRVSRPVKAFVIVSIITIVILGYLWLHRPTPPADTSPVVDPATPGTSTPTRSDLEAFMNQLPEGPDLPEAELRAELETFMERLVPQNATTSAVAEPVSEEVVRTELVAFLERISPQ